MAGFNFHPNADEYDAVNALALACISKLTNAEGDTILSTLSSWGYPRENSLFLDRGSTQGLVTGNQKMILIAFRGTEITQLEDLKTDIKLGLKNGPIGQVHQGFLDALNAVWSELDNKVGQLRDNNQPLWLTGHSLGAALATLAASRLVITQKTLVQGLYTFGSPRVGNTRFASSFNDECIERTFRVRNNNDVVTRVPVPGLFLLRYRHVGQSRYYDAKGQLRLKISPWQQFLDRVYGRLEDLGKPGSDGLKDHGIDRYISFLERDNQHG